MNGVIFVGLQASGKSSFYSNHFHKTHLRLSLDMLKTRHREAILFGACLQSKQALVIDNTNPTKQSRQVYIQKLKQHKFTVTGYYFSSALEACLKRNALRKAKERIPDIGLKGTHAKLELPEYSEGFDQLYYVSLNNSGGFTVQEWNDEI